VGRVRVVYFFWSNRVGQVTGSGGLGGLSGSGHILTSLPARNERRRKFRMF
ncbi:hypothetical protein CCACVL1_25458, partial [Corchorus capsularis]